MSPRTALPMVPLLDAGDLPDDVRNELEVWNYETGTNHVCLHGDGGCVTRLWPVDPEHDRYPLPLTRAWLLSIGVVPDDRGRLTFAMEGT